MKLPFSSSRLVFAVLAFSLSACGTIINGSSQSIAVQSIPAGASVVIHNLKNEVAFTGTTPCTAELKRGAGFFQGARYHVKVTKTGHAPFETDLVSGVSGWYAGNIAFGGLIGMLIVDPATGGMYTLEPETVNAVLHGKHAGFFPREGELRVVLRREVPADLVPHLKPLPRES